MKSFRGPLIGLSLFMVVAMGLTWLVYATLRRDVIGATTPYSAVFTDVFGLRDGDDVRVAGVRVGRVQKIELQDSKLAKVDFIVQSDQALFDKTVASVTYENIVGQRYLGLSLGNIGGSHKLPAGATIPVERTDPSFDVGIVVNGFEPLFTLVNPEDLNNLTLGAVKSLQGDESSIARLVERTTIVTASFAGEDEQLGTAITNLNKMVETLAKHNDSLDHVITQTRGMVSTFEARRPELVSSLGSMKRVINQLSVITDDIYPPLNELIQREPGFARHLTEIEPQLAFSGANLPLLLKGLARITNEGAYGNAYACDLNALGFFPGLNDVTPVVVNAATPGNRAQYSPKCRNLANG
jgi:phospholipid/cholesterol/gamma-HCH transport system substrate-binding protein